LYTLIKSFDELTVNELYDILHLRNKCFILDQQIPYQDLDYYDQESDHVLLYDDSNSCLAAYARSIRPGVRFKEASIGRVCVHEDYRGLGLYDTLVQSVFSLGHKEWRAVTQQQFFEIWKRYDWIVDKEVIEDGVKSYEIIPRR